jgi:para-aminobenzoate synthetase component I
VIGAAVGTTDLDWLQPADVTAAEVAVPRTADGHVDLTALARAGAPLLLESAPGTPGTGDWSFAVIGTAGRLRHDGTSTWLDGPTGRQDLGADAFTAIDRIASAMRATPDDAPPTGFPPFVGGLAGAWSYDLGRLVESVPTIARADRQADWMDLRVVTDLIAVDHRDERAWRVRRPVRGGTGKGDDVLQSAASPGGLGESPPTATASSLTSSLSHRDYLAAVARVLEHIAAGDVFQVNLTQRLTCTWSGTAIDLYERLRSASPAPQAALVMLDDGTALASISPESFLQATGRQVQTRPIKGTRPRAEDPAADALTRQDLVSSAKDRAENVMVVDMERNDLGRVCVPGSIHVTDLLEPEAHPTVWQLVSTVAGTLADDIGWGDLLRATFPSGSVTGTPKVRAMQIIDHLEPVRRSWYCGSIGWLGPGSASLSVAIRTAVLSGTVLDYAAGGGIVADSDPEREVAESWDKAAAFLRAAGLHPTGDAHG